MNVCWKLSQTTRACTATVGAALLFALPPAAYSQQGAPAAKDEQAARLHQQDQILKADVPFMNDSWRAADLKQSPRRQEMVKSDDGSQQAFVVYPAASAGKVPVVVMMPEDQGVNNWAKDIADEIAEMGAVVIVPDWLAGRGPRGGGRESFPDVKSALMANYDVNQEMTTATQNYWADWGLKLPASNGKLVSIGFGWGAGRAFWFATQRKDLRAACIFYDWAPPESELAKLSAPVYGFYADQDTRVEKTIEPTRETMSKLGKQYVVVDYKGAEHMFVRLGEMAANDNPANLYARNDSLARLQKILIGLQ